jgi:acyl-CoA synthetase (AMP-forming)/AMP-acid ligase II
MLYHSPFLQLLEQLPGGYEICTDKKQTLTAKELIEKSRSLAFYLQTKGVRRGDAVLLACDTGIEFLVLFMALLHLRTKTALVDPHMGNERYASKIKQFQPKWAFIDNRLLLLQEHRLIELLQQA